MFTFIAAEVAAVAAGSAGGRRPAAVLRLSAAAAGDRDGRSATCRPPLARPGRAGHPVEPPGVPAASGQVWASTGGCGSGGLDDRRRLP
jgi:hypothetical protein